MTSRQQNLSTFLIAACMMMLGGCGSGNDSSTPAQANADGPDINHLAQGLQPGEFELNIGGFVVSTGPYSGDGPAARFQPWTYSQARERADGYGGRERVDPWNATGPYRIWLHSAVSRDGGDEDMASTWIQLPPAAQAGQTYTIRHSRRAREGEAYAGLQRRDMAWRDAGQALEGEIHIAEIGDHLSASFHFHNGRDDEQRVEVQGRVYRVPFMPRGEAFYSYTRDGETEQVAVRVLRQAQDHRFEVMTELVSFSFGPDPEPGIYRLAARRDWDNRVVGVAGGGVRMDSVDGTLELIEQDGYFTMNFQFSTEGQTPVAAEGRFEWVSPPQAN